MPKWIVPVSLEIVAKDAEEAVQKAESFLAPYVVYKPEVPAGEVVDEDGEPALTVYK